MLTAVVSLNAQILKAEELEKYAKKKYGEKWTLDACFPFAAKDSHKKTSCKALIMAHAYSNVVMDKIEECIKNGLTGNENDNW